MTTQPMKLFHWFDSGEVDALASAIAAELVQRVPPAKLEARDRKAALKLRGAHDAVFSRAANFARNHKLNLYKKARLGNQFRWALREAGYPGEFVEAWTYELVELITRTARGTQ
jgi:hypothetical protein